MGFLLSDLSDESRCFHVNFSHWRTIVEMVRRLETLEDSVVDGLHQQWCGTGLTREQALTVADALERHTLPELRQHLRVTLSGKLRDDPDDGVFHRTHQENNYSTDAAVVESFVAFCRSCRGFDVG